MNPPLSDHLIDEVHGLTLACLGGEATVREVQRLDELLLDSEDVRRIYADAIQDSFILHRWAAAEELRADDAFNANEAGMNWSPAAIDDAEVTPDLLDIVQPAPSVLHNACRGAVSYFSQVGPLSYLIATIVLSAMLLGAWAYKITNHPHIVHDKTTPAENIETQYVGRITGLNGCAWAKDSLATMVGASVPVGREYVLSSGLMEITYSSGARVILEGPCEYTVDSDAGGYLAVGKLTARIDGRGKSEERRGLAASATGAKHHAATTQPPAPSPQPLAPLFAVTTPTAVVTDLGTEFGVEVSESGSTTSHVFRGSVKVQVVGNGSKKEVVLRANESVRVESDGSGRLHINQYTVAPGTFSRQIPRLVYIKVFNTGIGLKEGDRDPHWQLTARSDDPDFKPMQAVVASADISGGLSKYYLQNDSARSQWVSIAGDLPKVPCDATYTFSTTFELADLVPGSAVLRGWFLVDNHVAAIRLNGESQSVNDHGYTPPFNRFSSFVIRDGFVDGTNVLEIEVSNQSPGNTANVPNRVALLVKLQGVAVCGGHVRAASAHAPRKDAGKEAQTKK